MRALLALGIVLAGVGACVLPDFEKVDVTPDASAGGSGGGGAGGTAGSGATGGNTGGAAGAAGAAGSGGSVPAKCDTAIQLAPSAAPRSCPTGSPQAQSCGKLTESCCTTACVPGGTYDPAQGNVDAGVKSASVGSFYLDKYEVSLGRYKQFLLDDAPHPTAGQGQDEVFVGGWNADWDSELSNGADGDFNDSIYCIGGDTDGGAANDDRPVNCVPWYWALAFCIWDRGRLPTEAEWMLAASGGENRLYAWGSEALSATTPQTAAACDPVAPSTACVSFAVPWHFDQYVAKPAAPFGHVALTGNVSEFALDFVGLVNPQNGGGVPSEPLPADCQNCWVTSGSAGGFPLGVAARGGGFHTAAEDLASTTRGSFDPEIAPIDGGFRCARRAIPQ